MSTRKQFFRGTDSFCLSPYIPDPLCPCPKCYKSHTCAFIEGGFKNTDWVLEEFAVLKLIASPSQFYSSLGFV